MNELKDENGVGLVRKSFIITGLGLDDSGKWHKEQLTSRLQALIDKHEDAWSGPWKPKIRTRNLGSDATVVQNEKYVSCKTPLHTFNEPDPIYKFHHVFFYEYLRKCDFLRKQLWL